MSDENRLIELETKLTYQEKLIDELSYVVTEQWKSLNEVSKKINVLMKKFSDLEEQKVFEDIILSSSHQ
ncbi:SlyX family protein [Bartonella sp. 220]|uniref:SlyX family protein n=1 Tax=Bartonella sp. 220B TaxID=2967260 RepID=UPI0022A90F4E|nr:SlyX family protein [Bartonella sp. 220B]MCZ2158961.1 SlyX family protein [Bartonella sp. 220B]